MLRFNLRSLSVKSLVIENAIKTLAAEGLTCFSLTKHPAIPCNNFSGILASELNQVLNPLTGETLHENNQILQDDTKGVILYKGCTAVARLVINPHCHTEPGMEFVVALEQVLPGYPREHFLALLFQCTEAFIAGYIELSGHRDADLGSISLVVMCTRHDEDKTDLVKKSGFILTESYWGNENIANMEMAFEKVILDASLDGLSDSSSFLEDQDHV